MPIFSPFHLFFHLCPAPRPDAFSYAQENPPLGLHDEPLDKVEEKSPDLPEENIDITLDVSLPPHEGHGAGSSSPFFIIRCSNT